jgi:hypothetical protein
MLPLVDALFTLVRQLATRSPVIEISAPKWLVQRHGLAAMAARAGATSYRDDLARATLEWARIEQEISPVVAALVQAGVRVCPIKGAAYAKTLYGSPAERPMGDVDLLVELDRRDDVRRLLAELGFAPAIGPVMHHAEAWTRGDFALDLHWNIIAPGRSRIDFDAIWGRTRPGWPTGAEWLDPTDAMVFHLAHFARNRLRLPLMNVVDTARLLERVDAAVAVERARSWGLGRASELALRFCIAILDGRGGRPGGWLGPSLEDVALLSEDGVASKVLFDIATAGSPKQLASRVVHFAANRLHRLNSR